MRSLAVAPIPRNYSIFFACAAGQPTELVREIETAVKNRKPVDDALLDALYTTYLAEAQTRVVQNTTTNAKKILAEMMVSVTSFAEDTTAVGSSIAQQLQEFDAAEGDVKQLAATLVEGAASIENSSKTMSVSLAGAQEEITQLRQTLARVEIEAERDFLTGCFNRKAFDKRLGLAIHEADHNQSDLCLVMLDIDHFKSFNDNHGHLIGDEVLKIVAKALVDTLKGTDMIARYGGEEFAVILPRTPLGGGTIVAEAIRAAIASKELKRKSTGENFGAITISAGVAILRHGEAPSSLIERADKALYHSKHNGRNRVTVQNTVE